MTDDSTCDHTPTSFTLFTRLPPELRLNIWKFALPIRQNESILYHYKFKLGCWRSRPIDSSDQHLTKFLAISKEVVDFNYDLLQRPVLQLPLAFVNHEARAETLSWDKRGTLSLLPATNAPTDSTFVRSFDPDKDILHFDVTEWDHLLEEVVEAMSRPRSRVDDSLVSWSDAKYIALYKDILQKTNFGLTICFLLWFCFKSLEKIFIVVDGTMQSDGCDPEQIPFGWRQEAVIAEGGRGYIWDPTNNDFEYCNGQSCDNSSEKEGNPMYEEVQLQSSVTAHHEAVLDLIVKHLLPGLTEGMLNRKDCHKNSLYMDLYPTAKSFTVQLIVSRARQNAFI
ncbi:hypothetical protein K461DRAFT_297357 [Myriangium duriaei CBS 260.36]|uniref:2EXR domain-containing protein n=1 Tax=Myriangium duriaei CBS 260.36 TaxID=1168546 RepID=A0A9P4IW85_9PEZI|nr:hypothetical protein K461DRAFT_297357 [Myriangium duriaei CBS 260.36]